MVILRPKSSNRSCRFWDPNQDAVTADFDIKPPETVTAGFEAKSLETVAASFEAKPLETVATGFEAKPEKTVATGFEAKPEKTVPMVLRPNHWQTVAISFEAQTDEKPSEWFWGQTTHKSSTLVLSHNQKTHAPRLHVHGVDHTRRHPTSQSSGHRVPDLCDHPDPLHHVSYSFHDPHHCTPCLTCHLHTTRQANVILQMKQDKGKINWTCPGFEFKPHQVNDSSQSN
jgi:hypothetical protein